MIVRLLFQLLGVLAFRQLPACKTRVRSCCDQHLDLKLRFHGRTCKQIDGDLRGMTCASVRLSTVAQSFGEATKHQFLMLGVGNAKLLKVEGSRNRS